MEFDMDMLERIHFADERILSQRKNGKTTYIVACVIGYLYLLEKSNIFVIVRRGSPINVKLALTRKINESWNVDFELQFKSKHHEIDIYIPYTQNGVFFITEDKFEMLNKTAFFNGVKNCYLLFDAKNYDDQIWE